MPGKSAVSSLTIWGAVVVVLAQLARLLGYQLSADDQGELASLMAQAAALFETGGTLVGAAMAFIGRLRATRPITSALPKTRL